SYVLWKEFVSPLIAIEFVSGNGSEERDTTPPSETEKAGKFWVYEQAIRVPFYVIFDGFRDNLEAYHLLDSRYVKMQPNDRGHFAIAPMGVELGLILENGVSWLRWWDESGNLLLTGDERAIAEKQARLDAEAIANQQTAITDQERLAKQEAEQKAKRLAEKLRSLDINPDDL
ncbi:MAG: Uma2 family endonuclease, partial [Pseudanabaena sp.]